MRVQTPETLNDSPLIAQLPALDKEALKSKASKRKVGYRIRGETATTLFGARKSFRLEAQARRQHPYAAEDLKVPDPQSAKRYCCVLLIPDELSHQGKLYVCMYVCMHVYIHAYIHTCIHAYIHTDIYAYIHTYIHTYTYICTYIHIYIHIYIYIYMYIHIYIYIYIYITYTHMYIYLYILIFVCVYIYSICICSCDCFEDAQKFRTASDSCRAGGSIHRECTNQA